MFDSREELLDKVRLGEDSVFELKSVRFRGDKVEGPKRDDLADEFGSFANSPHGGVLLLGVDDKTREIEGIPLDRLDAVERFVREILNDSLTPSLAASIIRMELPDSSGTLRPVLKVEFERSLLVHLSPGGYFHRVGSSKRRMPPELLARLFQQRSQAGLIRFDEQPVPKTSASSLSERLWRRFIPQSTSPPAVLLEKRALLARDDSGELRASVAGILLACEEPDEFLPWAYIEAAAYRGTARDSNYQLDASRIRGPLDEQVRQAMLFLRRNQKVAAVKTPARVETPQFSEQAVFEAIVNAVAHRDYSVHVSRIRFFLLDDRLEIYSPGALANTITVDTLESRQATRNELISRLLSEIPVPESAGNVSRKYYMERRGDGVPLILNLSTRLSGRRPEYRLIDDSELWLTIFAASVERADAESDSSE